MKIGRNPQFFCLSLQGFGGSSKSYERAGAFPNPPQAEGKHGMKAQETPWRNGSLENAAGSRV
eukprot:6463275-Amphidinium_carterae.1